MSISVNDFLTAALVEIRVARGGDVASPDDMDLALTLFNELLDAWNADARAVYNRTFTTFTLTANLQPHTIGLAANTPTFTVTIARPTKVLNANLILSNNIRVPFILPNGERGILNDDQWNAITAGAAAGQAVTITASVPRYLYYSSGWPNGSIYLWPVPSTAYGLELETDTLLAAVELADTLDLPPGYQQALRLTLAETLCGAFGQNTPPSLMTRAKQARDRIFGVNDQIPDLDTRDAGMPSGGSRRGRFNYLTGQVQ